MAELAEIERTIAQANATVGAVTADQLGNPTPCAEWDVRALLNHITAGGLMFATAVATGGLTDEYLGELMTVDQVGDDFAGSFATAADAFLAAFRGVEGDPIVSLKFMPDAPVSVVGNLAVMDLSCHLVDLARATGQDVAAMDGELMAKALAYAETMVGPEMRTPGYFGEPTEAPAGAPAGLALQAFLGRTV